MTKVRRMWGIYLRTWLRGKFVGQDHWKNRYYHQEQRDGWKNESRWVLYHGTPEASKVPPSWNAWLRHERQHPPLQNKQHGPWERPYLPNLTGTRWAFFDFHETPSLSKSSYQVWVPPSSDAKEKCL